MLRLEQVAKVYRRRGEAIQAFECGSLTIDRGDYVATVGPSGSGKTTLLSVLGGMLAPTQGTVWVEDRSLYEMSIVERARLRSRRIGFVFQSFNLVPYLTALENVQLPLLLAGEPPAAQRERAARLLERFGLASRLHHKPSELSVGQQQRVAIARTLANDPEILLADEPTGNLDPDSRAAVLAALRDCHEEGRTIVMVTHDPVAASHADRILTMRSGVLVDDSSSPRVQLVA